MIVRWQALPLWLTALILVATNFARAEDPKPLTTAASVRALSPEQAAKEYPVQLTGTLLLVTRQRDALVLRDESDGIYVELNHVIGNARRPGDRRTRHRESDRERPDRSPYRSGACRVDPDLLRR